MSAARVSDAEAAAPIIPNPHYGSHPIIYQPRRALSVYDGGIPFFSSRLFIFLQAHTRCCCCCCYYFPGCIVLCAARAASGGRSFSRVAPCVVCASERKLGLPRETEKESRIRSITRTRPTPRRKRGRTMSAREREGAEAGEIARDRQCRCTPRTLLPKIFIYVWTWRVVVYGDDGYCMSVMRESWGVRSVYVMLFGFD